MFFDNWSSILRVLIVGVITYAGMVVLLRVSGNRTLSKMNSFDLVVTVAFGSTLSSILIDSKILLAEGITAIALLIGLQFAVTWLSVRSAAVSKLVKTRPTLLVRDGKPDREAMRLRRVAEDEIRSALRKHGLGSYELAAAVVLESDGSLSVISKQQQGDASALQGIEILSGAERGR